MFTFYGIWTASLLKIWRLLKNKIHHRRSCLRIYTTTKWNVGCVDVVQKKIFFLGFFKSTTPFFFFFSFFVRLKWFGKNYLVENWIFSELNILEILYKVYLRSFAFAFKFNVCYFFLLKKEITEGKFFFAF